MRSRRPRRTTLFPYTTLFRSKARPWREKTPERRGGRPWLPGERKSSGRNAFRQAAPGFHEALLGTTRWSKDRSLVCPDQTSQRHGNGFDNFAQNRLCSFRLFLQRGVARAGHHAMREDRDRELLEIIRQAVVAPIEERTRLRGALQHKRTARAHAESELLWLARATDN